MTRTLSCTLASLVASFTLATQAEIVLLEDGRNALPIYAAKADQQMARQLAHYLGEITGAEFTTQAPEHDLPERGIFVGPLDPTMADGLEPDDFRICVRGQQLHLVGGVAQGTAYAVYALLEQLGCRWWSHNEEDVPHGRPTLVLPDQDSVTRSPFAIHAIWNDEAQSKQNRFVLKARTAGWELFTGGHTLYPLLTPYAEQHPEIYPLGKGGKRAANKLHFCYLAPGIAEALTEALAKEVERRQGDVTSTIYHAGMGDWYGGMCECEECRKVYEEEAWTDPEGRRKPGYTGTLLRMINRTAELLEKRYPGVRVGTFAYMSLEAPPAKTVPRRNVVIRVPRLRHCTVHPAATCPKNASFARNVERWCELAPGRVYIWEYGASYRNFLYPFPCLSSMAENLRFYRRQGIRGVEIQGNYVSLGGDLAVLKNYVWRRVLWNPELAVEALLQEFCDGYYGPASADIQEYVDVLERSVREPASVCADEFARCRFLTPEVCERLAEARHKALTSADGKEPYAQRVREATAGLEALALWKPGPLLEQGDRLVRTDLGGDSLPRAEELVKCIRDASPSEWSSGRAARMNFLRYHGGPLLTLARGPLTVKVASLLNGQIRQITYRGQDLLYVEKNSAAKGYPLLGGAIDHVGTRLMTIDGDPSSTRIRLQGEGKIGMFGGSTKQLVWKTIDLADDETIAVTGAVRRLTKQGNEQCYATLLTTYAVGKEPHTAVVESLDKDGRWQPVAIAADAKEIALPELSALRIHLPAQRCIVLDEYATEIQSGKIVLDRKAGTLQTAIVTVPAAAPLKDDNVFLERRIRVDAAQ